MHDGYLADLIWAISKLWAYIKVAAFVNQRRWRFILFWTNTISFLCGDKGYIVKYKIMYLCTYYGVPVHYIYIYVKLSSSLPKDILYTTNSTVHCMTHAPFVIVCTLPYIWTIKVLFFLNLIHRLSDQSICIETKRTFKRKVNINKF